VRTPWSDEGAPIEDHRIVTRVPRRMGATSIPSPADRTSYLLPLPSVASEAWKTSHEYFSCCTFGYGAVAQRFVQDRARTRVLIGSQNCHECKIPKCRILGDHERSQRTAGATISSPNDWNKLWHWSNSDGYTSSEKSKGVRSRDVENDKQYVYLMYSDKLIFRIPYPASSE
jgi:hypothetical protein